MTQTACFNIIVGLQLVFQPIHRYHVINTLLKDQRMHTNFVLSGFILTLFSVSSAQAQVTIDASKITCDQFVHGKVGEPRTVAAWLSGFYNGKRNNALIDTQNFQANLNKLEKFCYDEKNFSLPVMQAIERAVGSAR
jgi:acid stress chaperone HdeB